MCFNCCAKQKNVVSTYPVGLGDGLVVSENIVSYEAMDTHTTPKIKNPLDNGADCDCDGNLAGGDSVAYCNMILRSIDCFDSEEEKNAEDDMATLPVDTAELIKSSGLKRSLLSSLDEVMEVEKNPD